MNRDWIAKYIFDEFEYCKIQCVCIKSIYKNSEMKIQEGIIYTCEGLPSSHYYSVTTDNKYYGVHDKKNFIPLAEWRQQQIDKILEDE